MKFHLQLFHKRSLMDRNECVSSDLMKTAVKEFLNFCPLKRHRLEITVIVCVEEGQSLPLICEIK